MLQSVKVLFKNGNDPFMHDLRINPFGFILASGLRHRATFNSYTDMNRKEIANKIRTEADELEILIKKIQTRRDHLKSLANELDPVGTQPDDKGERPFPKNKFWKLVDKVYADKA
jgi:hypothetical protein